PPAVGIDDSQAGGVIAAILEAPQPLDQNIGNGTLRDRTNDATHLAYLLSAAMACSILLAWPLPVIAILLGSACNRQLAFFHIPGNDRTGPDCGALADCNRGHQGRIGADKDA